MDTRRKRYLIASALFEYIRNEAGKPFELQHHNDVEDMQHILDTEFTDFVDVLATRKAAGHRNLAGTMTVVKDGNGS
jgi:hypothetical protein